MKKIFEVVFLFSALLLSCTREEDPSIFPGGKGLFILNEGNFQAGNGSLSFYSTENGSIYNNLFHGVNNRDLGDVPMHIAVDGNAGYVIVNNSGTIEKIDMETLESLGTVTGLNSPRQMVIYNGIGYVSSIYSNYITMIDLSDFTVMDENIDLGCSSEALVISGSRLFAANYMGGSKVVVVDLTDNTIEDEITTGKEPESMVLDKNNKLWVLCTGGWNVETGKICIINTSTLIVEDDLSFSTVAEYPSSLTINSGGDTLYYINNGVYRMPVTAEALPSAALVSSGSSLFYKVAPAPWKGLFCVTDAVDYVQAGKLLVYNKNGELIDTESAGIIPGCMHYSE